MTRVTRTLPLGRSTVGDASGVAAFITDVGRQPELPGGILGKLVAALVFSVPTVTAYPLERDLMFRAVIEELLPQVTVHRLAAFPALPPARTPALWESRPHRGDEILGVRDEGHHTR